MLPSIYYGIRQLSLSVLVQIGPCLIVDFPADIKTHSHLQKHNLYMYNYQVYSYKFIMKYKRMQNE